jgi:hypothetical protein
MSVQHWLDEDVDGQKNNHEGVIRLRFTNADSDFET